MSEQVVAAPAASVSPESAPAVDNAKENAELDAAELESDDSEGDESKEAAPKAKEAEKKAIEKRLKKLKLKIDGKEENVELDLDNDEELVRHLQLSKMGQKRAAEKAELENDFRKFFAALQEDPMGILAQEFQMNPEELIEAYINKQMEQAKKSPEQLEREKMESELKSLREEREREKKEFQEKELARLTEQEYEQMDLRFDQAFAKSDIPRNEYMVKKVADLMILAVEAGHDVSPEDCIAIVKEEMQSDIQKMFQVLPEETVEALLGDQVLNKLRKRRIAKAKDAQSRVAKPQIQETGKTQDDKPKAGEKVDYRKFFGV